MRELKSLKGEVDYIKEFLEDTHLTPSEKKFVDSKIKKIKSGDTSDFVPFPVVHVGHEQQRFWIILLRMEVKHLRKRWGA